MRTTRPKSIALGTGPQPRVYRTFEDWESEQRRDSRTPEERGIRVGSSVMWRHKHNNVIVTDRALVLEIDGDMIKLQVKDIKERTCKVHVREIVTSDDDASRK